MILQSRTVSKGLADAAGSLYRDGKGSRSERGNSLPGRRLFSFEPGKLDDIETRAFEGSSRSETNSVRSKECASVQKRIWRNW
ncbi:hypothetical protein FIB18_04395 [Brucella pecoris]|uniref:Uncharacterized protein n=1 Tax=Brucella pecoris TaxID=867683 RepID=A0A5C5CTN9_9HYPH|nr:hypothetical protein FIB18_04395 [Brucella pecoris]